jgi:hypothetical protein
MYKIDLNWKEFNVDMEAVDAKLKADYPGNYLGNQAHSVLELYFQQDPQIIPMQEQQQTVQQQAVDSETGELLVDENGDPVMVDVVETIQVAAGPSVKDQVLAYWESINEESEEVLSYRSSAQIMAAIQALKEGIPAKTWNQMNAVERKLVLNLAISKADLISAGVL